MKSNLIFLIFLFYFTTACATAPRVILKFQDRRYRPCSVEEIKKFRPNTDKITFCWRYCYKYKVWRSHVSKNCKEWKTDVLDSKEDFLNIRAAGFVLINEKRIY